MIRFPNCKINLGLHITKRRADGYHDLATVFYPLPIHDALEFIRTTGEAGELVFATSGLPVSGSRDENLCVKAYHLLQSQYSLAAPVQMHLHKNIPMGAGLGGGSADGAFALVMLNDLFQLGISDTMLEQHALALGSDCPFFIRNTPCYATGRGEIMDPVALDLSAYRFVVVHPGIHVSTAAAFAGITPSERQQIPAEIIAGPVENWRHNLHNDFEATVFAKHPEIADIKQQLYAAGAVYASMTGTGSAVYGIFEKEIQPVSLSFPTAYRVLTTG